MSSIAATQTAILSQLRTDFVQPIVEQGIPDVNTVRRNAAGAIDPYIAIQFGDLQQGRARAMTGPRNDDYIMPLYFQCIAPTIEIARGLHNKLLDVFLGESFAWAGQVRKRPGGGYFTVTNSNAATEAYMMPASFGLPVQFE